MEKSKNEESVFITFLRSGLYLMIPFIFLFGIGGIFALFMGWSISCSTKQSGAYERYDAMEAELNAIPLPEKTILNSTNKGVRSIRVYSMRGYYTNYPENELIPYYYQYFRKKGWLELGEKDAGHQYGGINNGEIMQHSFKRKDWKLELVTYRDSEDKNPSYLPFSYGYWLEIKWER